MLQKMSYKEVKTQVINDGGFIGDVAARTRQRITRNMPAFLRAEVRRLPQAAKDEYFTRIVMPILNRDEFKNDFARRIVIPEERLRAQVEGFLGTQDGRDVLVQKVGEYTNGQEFKDATKQTFREMLDGADGQQVYANFFQNAAGQDVLKGALSNGPVKNEIDRLVTERVNEIFADPRTGIHRNVQDWFDIDQNKEAIVDLLAERHREQTRQQVEAFLGTNDGKRLVQETLDKRALKDEFQEEFRADLRVLVGAQNDQELYDKLQVLFQQDNHAAVAQLIETYRANPDSFVDPLTIRELIRQLSTADASELKTAFTTFVGQKILAHDIDDRSHRLRERFEEIGNELPPVQPNVPIRSAEREASASATSPSTPEAPASEAGRSVTPEAPASEAGRSVNVSSPSTPEAAASPAELSVNVSSPSPPEAAASEAGSSVTPEAAASPAESPASWSPVRENPSPLAQRGFDISRPIRDDARPEVSADRYIFADPLKVEPEDEILTLEILREENTQPFTAGQAKQDADLLGVLSTVFQGVTVDDKFFDLCVRDQNGKLRILKPGETLQPGEKYYFTEKIEVEFYKWTSTGLPNQTPKTQTFYDITTVRGLLKYLKRTKNFGEVQHIEPISEKVNDDEDESPELTFTFNAEQNIEGWRLGEVSAYRPIKFWYFKNDDEYVEFLEVFGHTKPIKFIVEADRVIQIRVNIPLTFKVGDLEAYLKDKGMFEGPEAIRLVEFENENPIDNSSSVRALNSDLQYQFLPEIGKIFQASTNGSPFSQVPAPETSPAIERYPGDGGAAPLTASANEDGGLPAERTIQSVTEMYEKAKREIQEHLDEMRKKYYGYLFYSLRTENTLQTAIKQGIKFHLLSKDDDDTKKSAWFYPTNIPNGRQNQFGGIVLPYERTHNIDFRPQTKTELYPSYGQFVNDSLTRLFNLCKYALANLLGEAVIGLDVWDFLGNKHCTLKASDKNFLHLLSLLIMKNLISNVYEAEQKLEFHETTLKMEAMPFLKF